MRPRTIKLQPGELIPLSNGELSSWRFVEDLPPHITPSGYRLRMVLAVCKTCGLSTGVQLDSVRSGRSSQCGECGINARSEKGTTHGLTRVPRGWSGHELYKTWKGIIRRCLDHAHHSYHHYGGRGIKVWVNWQGPNGFIEFVRYVEGALGEKPSADHSIDRIDGSQGYFPYNIRWATFVEQSNNLKSTRYVEYHGERMPLSIAVRKSPHQVDYRTVIHRIDRGHWDVTEAIDTPPTIKRKQVIVTAFGITRTAAEWAEALGCHQFLIKVRIRQGIHPELAVIPENSQGNLTPEQEATLSAMREEDIRKGSAQQTA